MSTPTLFLLIFVVSHCHCIGLPSCTMWAKNGLCCRIAAVIFAAISICFLLNFPGWHEEVDENAPDGPIPPLPTRWASYFAFATSTLASLFSLVSVLWQHLASVAVATTAEGMAYGTLKGHIGLNAMILGWVGVAAFVLVSIGLWLMILSLLLFDIMIVF